MHRILQDIINNTNIEIKKRRNEPVEGLTSYRHLPFKQRVLNPKIGDIGLIAEVKLASPTTGKLGKKEDILNRLLDYQAAGADAVSVITETKNFKGSLNLVTTVKRSILDLPILQKDFIIDDFQIEEARKLGTDALLLIARIVNTTQLKRFVKQCREKGLEPVVEVCSLGELSNAINSGTEIIAVNARNLDTFEVDVDRACNILKRIPEKFIKLGFSGIHSRVEVEKYKKAGVSAVLVGTELMKTKKIDRLIKELKLPVKVKICGIKSIEAAKTAVNAGADFLGFNFVPDSKRYIDHLKAEKMINEVRDTIKIVGVFQDAAINYVNHLAVSLKLDYIQLHGREDDEYINQLILPVIKSITVSSHLLSKRADYLLLDRPERGKGRMINLQKAAKLAAGYPLFFAGGLNPDNVVRVIQKVRPFAVDVAGGIETDGHQDLEKIRLFVRNAKGESL